jgi:hypothetical protein
MITISKITAIIPVYIHTVNIIIIIIITIKRQIKANLFAMLIMKGTALCDTPHAFVPCHVGENSVNM